MYHTFYTKSSIAGAEVEETVANITTSLQAKVACLYLGMAGVRQSQSTINILTILSEIREEEFVKHGTIYTVMNIMAIKQTLDRQIFRPNMLSYGS